MYTATNPCKQCKKTYKTKRKYIIDTQQFCSVFCHNEYQSQTRQRENCLFWKGGRYYKKNGYVLAIAKNHPNRDSKGYYLEHRIVAEQYLGRYLKKHEVIHHLNGKRDDNAIANLYLFENDRIHCDFHYKKPKKHIFESNLIKFLPLPKNAVKIIKKEEPLNSANL